MASEAGLSNADNSHAPPPFFFSWAGGFDSAFVVRQLRSLGLLDTIRMKAAGYPAHFTFREFVDRYFMLLPSGADPRGRKKARHW